MVTVKAISKHTFPFLTSRLFDVHCASPRNGQPLVIGIDCLLTASGYRCQNGQKTCFFVISEYGQSCDVNTAPSYPSSLSASAGMRMPLPRSLMRTQWSLTAGWMTSPSTSVTLTLSNPRTGAWPLYSLPSFQNLLQWSSCEFVQYGPFPCLYRDIHVSLWFNGNGIVPTLFSVR